MVNRSKYRKELFNEMNHKDECLLSVIIPVYNTELYLEECLDSILEQKIEDYEILIVNDGSTDTSKDIILSYKAKYPFIRYFEQENSGQGTARNVGIDNARGKYIYFMDSDDYLAEGKLKEMLICADQNDLDAIFFDGKGFLHENPEKNMDRFNYKRSKEYGLFSQGELLLHEFSQNNEVIIQPCLYITKRRIIVDNKLYFPDHFKHEDEYFTVTLFLYINKCFHTNKDVFMRRVRANSTMTNPNKIPSFQGYVNVLQFFDRTYSSFKFKTDVGRKAYRKKMKQLTKASFRSYSQIVEKDKVQNELKVLNKFVEKYQSFDLLTYLYISISKSNSLLSIYSNIAIKIKK